MTTFDYAVIALYLLLVNIIGTWKASGAGESSYLLNSRNTSFLFLLCSTVATIAGAGSVVGVSAEASRTGISFGVITAAALTANMLLYSLLVPRIRAACDHESVRTPAELVKLRYGLNTHKLLTVTYIGIAVIWTAVQFLAIGNLLAHIFGIALPWGLALAYLVVTIYTARGGLKSDIFSDFLEFWVKFLVVVVLVPTLVSSHSSEVSNLSSSFFDPTAYGGITLLIGSALIGGMYPLAQAHDWLRINSARTSSEARRTYLFALPLVLSFIAAATFLGLVAASDGTDAKADTVIFAIFERYLPLGLKGLAYAGILAVVMSSINSLMLGGAATAYSFFPKDNQSEAARVKTIKWLVTAFGLVSVVVAGFFPNIVTLTVIASFVSVCLGPVILYGIYNRGRSDRTGAISIILGLSLLFGTMPFLGTSAFLPGVIGALVPLLFKPTSKAEHMYLDP